MLSGVVWGVSIVGKPKAYHVMPELLVLRFSKFDVSRLHTDIDVLSGVFCMAIPT